MLTRLIGLAYRIPMNNILGDEGQGFYGVAFEIYSIALLLTSYSLPLAMSKLVSSRKAQGKMGDVAKVLKTGLMFALVVGGAVALIVFLAADKIATGVMSMHLSSHFLVFCAASSRDLAPCIRQLFHRFLSRSSMLW